MPDIDDGLASYIVQVLREVCFGSDEEFPLEETIARYFAPEYTQLTDGVMSDYDLFTEHIRTLRRRVIGGTVVVERLVRDGSRFADRHALTMTTTAGAQIRSELYMFGEVANDGRLLWVEELSRLVEGGAEHADIASAR